MEKKLLWFFLMALLGVDVFMLMERNRLVERLETLQDDCARGAVQIEYAEEEEALLTQVQKLPADVLRSLQAEDRDGAIRFVLLASVDDCTNCIEDEIFKLNRMSQGSGATPIAVEGFFVDEERADQARRFIENLNPAPLFSLTVRDVVSVVPKATTPLVLVVRNRDARILDAHKPIPEDLSRRDAFYARWTQVLGLD